MSLTPEQQALVAVRRMRARLEELEGRRAEPIAVIGIGCRFPGGVASPDAYWQLLRDGVDAVTEVPPDRWDIDAYYDADPDAPGKMHTRHGGFVGDIDRFDPHFFGIAPREAVKMDPQQRMLLEIAWEALEHAGRAPDRLAGSRTGVFLGLSSNDYVQLLRDADPEDLDAYNLTGNAANFAAGRISYLLGLQGPSLTVDTACSSSLVAVHLACQSLRNGESRLALAGGANAILVPDHNVLLSKARMLAPDGRCKTFDAAADGYVRGEGCGIVVLTRLADALADGDRVIAVLRGTAMNQDGRSSGLTVPNGPAQEALIREAVEASRLDPKDVAYVEAHGSGTSLGDPIEIRALTDALGAERTSDRTLLVGSAKTNLGHLEAAAGIAGLIKVVLSVQHGEIPPHLHVREPNPHIPWRDIPITIARELQPWPAAYARRIAGVSSFGASGTNAHVVVEQAPDSPPAAPARTAELLALSAKTEDGLRQLASRWAAALAARSDHALADVAFTATAGRAHYAHRLAVVATAAEDAGRSLEAFAAGTPGGEVRAADVSQDVRPQLAFLYTGQGAQYAGMGRELYESQPVFRAALDHCADLCGPIDGTTLKDLLFANGAEASRIHETGATQPALFAIEYALTELLRSWGLEPSVVLGHSVGGYAAACAAGILSAEDAARLIAARGRLMQTLPAGGAMAAVFADEDTVRAAIEPHRRVLSIAAVNGADNIVISGARKSLDTVLDAFAASGIKAQRLRVSHAFHSPLMQPIREEFTRLAAGAAYADPRIACISDHSARVLQPGEVNAEYWAAHLAEPVRFAAALDAAYARGCRVFVEIGPKPTLSALGSRRLPEDTIWIPTLRENRSDWRQMLECVRDLYAAGADVTWPALFERTGARKIAAPTYPFKRERFWVARTARSRSHVGVDPWRDWLYRVDWRRTAAPAHSAVREETGKWLLFADRAGVGAALAAAVRDRGGSCTVVDEGNGFAQIAPDRFTARPGDGDDIARVVQATVGRSAAAWRRVVHLWGVDAEPGDCATTVRLDADAHRACGTVLHLVQALSALSAGGAMPPVTVITRGAHLAAAAADRGVAAVQAMAWGFARVVAREHPELRLSCVDLERDTPMSSSAVDALLDAIDGEHGEDELAVRGGELLAPRLLPDERSANTAEHLVRGDGAYIVTGASGGLGTLLAEHLVSRGARHLVLVARRTTADSFRCTVAGLEHAGARIDVASGTVADPDFVRGLVEALTASGAVLRGVVHAAGALDDGVVAQQSWERFRTVMEAKVHGAWNLHVAAGQLPLDFFVMFSSSAALLGAAGQANYAASNAFMDALAHHRRSQGLSALSINWGPWSGVGAAARGGVVERGASRGLRAIDPVNGLHVFDALAASNATQAAAINADWSQMLAGVSERVPSLLRELGNRARAVQQASKPAAARPWLVEELESTPPLRRWPVLLEKVAVEAGTVLGVSAETLDPRHGLRDLGLDSLMALELRNRLQRALGRPLRSTLAFDFPTIDAIAHHIWDDILQPASDAGPSEAPSGADGVVGAAGTADLLLEIENLSDDEVEKLFASRASGAGA